ncbi:MAG: hypothetical protein J7K96_09230 [Desulfobacteraceae bacterium]|nr:hypothetical protein [Desulfobacteraceae bacterium]
MSRPDKQDKDKEKQLIRNITAGFLSLPGKAASWASRLGMRMKPFG